ncbi:sulfate ABC transporter substrate-binding protein [Marinimicrobium sp. ARAG 43.8]|uniref:sulfate ABC transporter substrate-binding protein n=1 Tax=Marinimicrobium sp. ARAG 43.8 TaxID=3418719 RepID=UPI003CFAEBC5
MLFLFVIKLLRKAIGVLAFAALSATALADTTLLNVSYDVSRELYKDINPEFEAFWRESEGEAIKVNQSHGGSSKQALSVASGLEGDVITMNQAPDIDMLAERGLVAKGWRSQYPHNATPYTTTSVFLVRKGNPKNIQDWDDLVNPEVAVIVPNPKTSGNGRYTYLAAWGYALNQQGSEEAAQDFVTRLFANVPVLDGGGRGATTSFTQRAIGDVLVTFENEAILIAKELGADQFDVVYPSRSIDASAPVAVIRSVTEKRGTTKEAEGYLNFLFSETGQEIIARHNFRPRSEAVLKRYQSQYPAIDIFSVESLGGWAKVREKHFVDGALFDQIMVNR